MDEHEWMRDPDRRGEGLICRNCRITEAEAEAAPGDVTRCPEAGRTDTGCDWMADDEAYAEAAYWHDPYPEG